MSGFKIQFKKKIGHDRVIAVSFLDEHHLTTPPVQILSTKSLNGHTNPFRDLALTILPRRVANL